MNHKRFYYIAALILLASLALSCNQDAIFYSIENETSLKNPIINGGPSGIVLFDGALYVAGSRVYRYANEFETDKAGNSKDVIRWRSIPNQPPGKVAVLGATNAYLYALSYTGANVDTMQLYRLTSAGGQWKMVARDLSYDRPKVIAGAGDTLFLGAHQSSGNAAGILYIKDSEETLTLGKGNLKSSGLLSAAAFAFGKYAIALSDQGIYLLDNLDNPEEVASAPSLKNGSGGDSVGIHFSALMEVKGSLLGIAKDGVVWQIPQSGYIATRDHNFDFTGAIAFWEDPEPDESKRKSPLLLLGRGHFGGDSDTYYDYGYFEIPITLDNEGKLGSIDSGKLNPGDSRSATVGTTVSVNAKYEASIGIHSMTSLYQVPRELRDPVSGDMPIFASTQQSGLWSCRDKEWNVED